MTGAVETRATPAEVLNVDGRARIITVIAVPWNEPTSVVFRGTVWQEAFARSAFDGIENRDPERIRVNREHKRGDTVGKVVRFINTDPRGLIAEIRIAQTQRGDDTIALAEDRCLSASISFSIRPGGETLNQTRKTRIVTRALLDHIALVESPAYAGAKVLSVRSATPNLNEFAGDPVFAWARRYLGRLGK